MVLNGECCSFILLATYFYFPSIALSAISTPGANQTPVPLPVGFVVRVEDFYLLLVGIPFLHVVCNFASMTSFICFVETETIGS